MNSLSSVEAGKVEVVDPSVVTSRFEETLGKVFICFRCGRLKGECECLNPSFRLFSDKSRRELGDGRRQ